jgi:hypothetical protein
MISCRRLPSDSSINPALYPITNTPKSHLKLGKSVQLRMIFPNAPHLFIGVGVGIGVGFLKMQRLFYKP